MTFYPQYPAGYYAYPVYPGEYYPMYGHVVEGHPPPPPPPSGPIPMQHGVYYPIQPDQLTSSPPNFTNGSKVPLRKDSADSGISDTFGSRKASNTSTISATSIVEEEQEVEDETPYESPDDATCEAIVAQVEFYFSDANITKDKFLLKHVRRNKEGFVSLKLISSFKRVKHITRDWRQVAEAVQRKSVRLEVNDLKTKVRRLEALPEYDETTPSRTVVALDLPLERPTIEAVAEIFKVCGEIVLVRIVRPGNPIPADVRPFLNKHSDAGGHTFALIEFERTEFAHKAIRELSNDEMKVLELTAPPPKSTKKDSDSKFTRKVSLTSSLSHPPILSGRRMSHAGFGQQSISNEPRRRISLNHNLKFEDKEISLNPNAPTFQRRTNHRSNTSRHDLQQMMMSVPPQHPVHAAAQAAAAQAAAAMYDHHHQQQAAAAAAIMASGVPLKRHPTNYYSDCGPNGLTLSSNIIRNPRGPDQKGKGFEKWSRARPDINIKDNPTIPRRKPGVHAVPIIVPEEVLKVEELTIQNKTEDDNIDKVDNVEEDVEQLEVSFASSVEAEEDEQKIR